jgi:rhodanese-related sulfurtransferase
VLVFDCRFSYEYVGGHIRTALHKDTDDAVLSYLFSNETPRFDQQTALVFHCEFSSRRGPSRCVSMSIKPVIDLI